jgi:hypothetical protein
MYQDWDDEGWMYGLACIRTGMYEGWMYRDVDWVYLVVIGYMRSCMIRLILDWVIR